MSKSAVISLSGGMDSTSLLINLINNYDTVYGISFNYGQKHIVELDKLNENLKYLKSRGIDIEHHVVDLSGVMGLFHSSLTSDAIETPEGFYEEDNMRVTVVPNRNAIFSSIIYGYALSKALENDTNVDICLGVHAGDSVVYPDCRREFYDILHAAFSEGNWDSERVNLHLPYLDIDKAGILQDAIIHIEDLGLDFNTIYRNTSTTYSPTKDGKSEGKTGSDVERILAFHSLGLIDPAEYTSSWETILKHALIVQTEFANGDH